MKHFFYISSLLVFFSCTENKKLNFSGDWKLVSMYQDNSPISIEHLNAKTTSFKSDNLVFYFNRLMRYEILNDSVFFYVEESNEIARKFKYKIENDVMSLTYLRKVKIDSVNTKKIIYESNWKKIK